MDTDNKNSEKYCTLFQENFNLELDEFNEIKNKLQVDGLTIDDKVQYIKSELGNNMFQAIR